MEHQSTITAAPEVLSKKPAKALQQLKIFEGTWKIAGQNLEGAPDAAGMPVWGEDYYTWLPGHFFLVENWKHLSGEHGHVGVALIGFDEEEDGFFSRNFDNLGFERKYSLKQNNRTWTFTGDKERAVREFSSDGKSYEENWEILIDNTWRPLCFIKAVKM